MPQLETVTYLCQYIWKLIVLFLLFLILVNFLLPRLQWQIVARNQFNSVEMKKKTIKLETILLV